MCLNPPTLPYELVRDIVADCNRDAAALRALALTSKPFLFASRQVLFLHTHVKGFHELLQLASLLQSELCTIPSQIECLKFNLMDNDIKAPSASGRKHIRKVAHLIRDVLQKIRPLRSLHFNCGWNHYSGVGLPSIPSRQWWRTDGTWRRLHSLALAGPFSHLTSFLKAVSQLVELETLSVRATWKDDSILAGGHLSRCLKEISISAPSFAILGWICTLQDACSSLRALKLETGPDDVGSPYPYLEYFVEKFGVGLEMVVFSIETKPPLCSWAYLMQYFVNIKTLSFSLASVDEPHELETFIHRWLPYFNSRTLNAVHYTHKTWGGPYLCFDGLLTRSLLPALRGQLPDKFNVSCHSDDRRLNGIRNRIIK